MRGLRSFVLLLVVLVGLGAYLYFVELRREPETEGDKREKVFTVEADKIEEIAIRSESGDRTTLRKSGSDWQIVQPTTAAADAAEVSGLTSNLSTVQMQRVIDENAADLKQYGLDPARVEVAFKAGGQEQRLLVGQKTPTGNDLYARVGDQKKVFLIASYLDSTFNRSTFDVRDKTALKVDREKIDVVEVSAGGSTTRLAKVDGEWQLTQPVATRADFSAVEGLVSRLGSLQMKSVVAQGEAVAGPAFKPGEYGLDKPAATVRIGTGSSQATLALGKPAQEATLYARDLSRPLVFTVESSLLDELKKGAGEYRQKDLFDARAFNTTRLEVTRNGQTQAFEKTQDKWRQVAPTAKDVDAGKMDALLSAITGARASEFVENAPKAALDKPELAVAIKFDDGKKEEQVTFARGGDAAYASRAGSQGVAKIEAATIDTIVKALEELK